jgi:hypothetical protein
MKQLISIFTLLIIVFFLGSCQKEIEKGYLPYPAITSSKTKSVTITDFGLAHNAILEKYFSINPNSTELTFWQKMTLIDQLMSEINPNIQQGSFLKMLNENPEHKEYLEKICQLNFNVSGAKEIIQKLALENKISTRTNFYSNQIINCINDDNSNLVAASQLLNNIELSISNDSILNEQEKTRLLMVVSIGSNSIDYWQTHNILKYSKGSAWVGSDVTGGTTAITSGLATWASAFGPWGSFVVIVGSAAAASAFS